MANKEKSKSSPARYWHSELKYRDIKRMAIERGMPFPEVVSGDFYRLISFIDSDRALKKPDPSLVLKFDLWLEQILRERGSEFLIKPTLRLSYVSDEMREQNNPRPKKEKVIKEKKPPREKDINNLVKGTKKSYTFELAQKGYDVERVKRRVLKKFPDASEKSIVIWYRKCLGIKHEAKPKKERVKIKKIKTPEEIALQKERAKERKRERALARKKGKERVEKYRETQLKLKKEKKNAKRRKAKDV